MSEGAPVPPAQVLQGHIPAAVARVQPAGRLDATNQLRLAIGLPLRNTNALNELLRQIYDPASPYYRQYLTPEQFTEQFGPTEQDYEALIAYAKANGFAIRATHPNRVVLDVAAPVSAVERAFHTTLRTYAHPRESRNFYAPDREPSLDLAVRVLHISGLDNYSLPRPNVKAVPLAQAQGKAPAAGSGPIGLYWGNDFRSAYAPGVTLDGSGQVVGLLEFDGYYASDIAKYVANAGLPGVPSLQNVAIDGFTGPPGYNNVEVALDIEMAIAMAPGLSKIVVYEAPNPSPWVDLLSRMASDINIKQFSCSWGGGPPDPTADLIFQQMAAQGQSFFNAVGDSDAFIGSISFPSDNPYVTEVGGTTLMTDSAKAWQSEEVWNWGNEYGPSYDGFGSSGGVSTYYSIPWWQQGLSSANQSSSTMRNTPDVALTADNIYIVADNGWGESVGGTSAAAPLWAAFLALVNQQAASLGQTSAGFINPAIYSIGKSYTYASSFHDIWMGDNTWSLSTNQFFAAPGYDLCTGWGTPANANLISQLAGVLSSGLLQITANPPTGANLIKGTSQKFAVTVTDGLPVTGATVTANVAGVTNLTLLDNGNPPDTKAGDGIYSASFSVPSVAGPLTVTIAATAPLKTGITNVFSYNLVDPPPNDNFANAIKVPAEGATHIGNNQFASLEPNEPAHAGDTSDAASLWWTYVPTINTNVFVDTTASAIDTVLGIYTGTTLQNLVVVAATNNVLLSKQAYLNVPMTAGTTYRIAVASANASSLGSLQLKVTPGGLPDTNKPVVAVTSPLSGLWVSNNYVILSGTANDPQPNGSGVRAVFCSVGGQWSFTASGTTNWSCEIVLRPGLNVIRVTAQDFVGNVSAPVNMQLTYYVVPVANDLFANAIGLTNDSGTVTMVTTNATKEYGEPDHAGNTGGKSVWWSFRPSADGVLVLNTTNSTFDTLLGLYTGGVVSQLTTLASDDDAYSGARGGFSFLSQAVRSNQTYYIAVDGYGGASGTASLQYSFTSTPVFHLNAGTAGGGAVQISTTNSLGGAVAVPANSADFASNSTVIVTAISQPYQTFSHWDGSFTSTANPLSLVLQSNVTLTAHFTATPFTDDFESGNLLRLAWSTAGAVPWNVQTNVVRAGRYAARSGAMANNQTSSLILATNFLAGTASFDYRVSSETNFDFFGFYLDGILLHRWSGEAPWSTFTFGVTDGPHTMEWRYTKDASLSGGLDAAFIDNVNLPLAVPINSSSPAHLQLGQLADGSFALDLLGQTNQQYVLQGSTNLTTWRNISTNIAVNGFIHIPLPVGGRQLQFYRAIASP